jgi:hypothetical protein
MTSTLRYRTEVSLSFRIDMFILLNSGLTRVNKKETSD